MDKVVNFTAEQENVIRGWVGSGENGALTLADATAIANDPRMFVDGVARKPRSIVGKISRMSLPYQSKVRARKDGSPVQSKADLVKQISASAGVTFEALDKAARGDLVKLRDVLAA